MDNSNPYSPPDALPEVPAKPRGNLPIVRRPLAIGMLVFSVCGAMLYTYFDEVILKTSVGAWPMLIASAGIAVLASILSRDWIFAPLCCFAATMAGDLLAASVRSWEYAQIEICLPLAAGFSIPSLAIAIAMHWHRKRQVVNAV